MNTKVPKREKFFYTTGLMGQNIIWGFMGMYIMFFFTDLLRIPTATTTAILVAASLWDAVNDVLMGMIIDRTRSRWGKFRPYLIIAPILIAIVTVLCFTRFNVSPASTAVIAAVIYILWGTIFDFVDIPLWALSSVISKNVHEKTQVVTLGKIGSIVGNALVTVGSIQVINYFGGERNPSAFFYATLIIAAIGAISIILTGIFSKERIEAVDEKPPFRDNLQTIYKNRPLLILMATLLIFGMVNHLRQNIQMYYVVYVLEDSGYMTLIGASLVLGMLLGMAVTPKLIRVYSKKKIFYAACLLGTPFCALPFFINNCNMTLLLILFGFSFAFTGVGMIATTSLLLDTIDYAEWKLGFRGEGIVFSAQTFLGKLSATIAKMLVGIGLGVLKYVENQPPTPSLQRGFNALMFILPAAFFILSIIPMFFYKISDQQQKEIRNELEQKRASKIKQVSM